MWRYQLLLLACNDCCHSVFSRKRFSLRFSYQFVSVAEATDPTGIRRHENIMAMFDAVLRSMPQTARLQPSPVRVDHDNILIVDHEEDMNTRHIAIETPPGCDIDVKEHIKFLNKTILEMYAKLKEYKG